MMTNETHVTGEPKLSERRLSTSLSTKMIPAAWQTPLPPRIETAKDSDPEAATSIVFVTETLVEEQRVSSVQARTLEKA